MYKKLSYNLTENIQFALKTPELQGNYCCLFWWCIQFTLGNISKAYIV